MTDHRAEALALIDGAAKTIHDVENRGDIPAVEFIGALQVAGVSAAIASAKALIHLGDQIAARPVDHLGVFTDGLTAGITEALARFAPCEPESQRAATAEQLVRERLADPAFMVRVSSRINARLDGAA